jgi:hypothetical protein
MRIVILSLIALTACSADGEGQPGGGGNASAAAPAAAPADSPAPGRIATLAGLYEGGTGEQKHQMCIVGGKEGERFGLVVWGSNLNSCSGSGSVSRSGDRLRLVMAGDSACTIEASISGNTVKLPAETPSGCAYYCGANASLAGAELKQVGTSQSDAMKANDIVGDPLCGEL